MPYVGSTIKEYLNGVERHDYPAFENVATGLENLYYSATGQTEKTTAFQTQMEREDSAMQRLAADYSAAGLSKFGISGNGSSTGSYGDGVPKGLQYANAIMDLKSKKVGLDATQAGIKKTLADAAYTDAMTVNQQNENRTFDEKFAADMAKSNAQAFLFQAQGRIADTEGQFAAEKITAEIDYKVQQASQLVLQNLFYPSIARSQIDLNNKNIERIAQDISLSVAQENHVNAQTQKIIEETTNTMLQTLIGVHNLDYAEKHGLPVGSVPSGLLGSALSTGEVTRNLIRSLLSGIKNHSTANGGHAW